MESTTRWAELVPLVEATGDKMLEQYARTNLVTGLLDHDDLAAALKELPKADLLAQGAKGDAALLQRAVHPLIAFHKQRFGQAAELATAIAQEAQASGDVGTAVEYFAQATRYHLAAKQLAAARAAHARAQNALGKTPPPDATQTFELSTARLEAGEGKLREALARAEKILAVFKAEHSLTSELEARLVVGQIELALDPPAGRAKLRQLAADARSTGHLFLARQASRATPFGR